MMPPAKPCFRLSLFPAAARVILFLNRQQRWELRTIFHLQNETIHLAAQHRIPANETLSIFYLHPLSRPVANAAESNVIARARTLSLSARSDHVARAVLACAKKRATPLHVLRYARLIRIEGARRPLGIVSDSPRRQPCVVIRAIPIIYPLPHVTGHVI